MRCGMGYGIEGKEAWKGPARAHKHTMSAIFSMSQSLRCFKPMPLAHPAHHPLSLLAAAAKQMRMRDSFLLVDNAKCGCFLLFCGAPTPVHKACLWLLSGFQPRTWQVCRFCACPGPPQGAHCAPTPVSISVANHCILPVAYWAGRFSGRQTFQSQLVTKP
jgi:hypothetical protein